jgi:hypothetical protein
MTITFERTTSQPILIELVIDDDAHLDELVSACRAGAYALGYGMDSILDRFKTSEEIDTPISMVPLEEDY